APASNSARTVARRSMREPYTADRAPRMTDGAANDQQDAEKPVDAADATVCDDADCAAVCSVPPYFSTLLELVATQGSPRQLSEHDRRLVVTLELRHQLVAVVRHEAVNRP